MSTSFQYSIKAPFPTLAAACQAHTNVLHSSLEFLTGTVDGDEPLPWKVSVKIIVRENRGTMEAPAHVLLFATDLSRTYQTRSIAESIFERTIAEMGRLLDGGFGSSPRGTYSVERVVKLSRIRTRPLPEAVGRACSAAARC